jgi:hypothetical protein
MAVSPMRDQLLPRTKRALQNPHGSHEKTHSNKASYPFTASKPRNQKLKTSPPALYRSRDSALNPVVVGLHKSSRPTTSKNQWTRTIAVPCNRMNKKNYLFFQHSLFSGNSGRRDPDSIGPLTRGRTVTVPCTSAS